MAVVCLVSVVVVVVWLGALKTVSYSVAQALLEFELILLFQASKS